MTTPEPWAVTAVNLPEHADNPVHTDTGAQAAGFDRALVAGTTVYAYLTHPAMAAWGVDWLARGGGELRLRRPIFDRDRVQLAATEAEVAAVVEGDVRATLSLERSVPVGSPRGGEALADIEVQVTEADIDYGVRGGDDLAFYVAKGIAPPVTWVRLANTVFIEHLVDGPWVHVRSRIAHRGIAELGEQLRVQSTLVERFESGAGERAVVDIEIRASDRAIASIEHEAIVNLP